MPTEADAAFAPIGRLEMFTLCLLSVAAFSLIHPPLTIWPLAYVCLVPWVVSVVRGRLAPWVYLSSWLFGFLIFFVNLYWIWEVAYVDAGPVRIPAGALALALFESFCFPLAAWVIRHGRRIRRMPLWMLLPVVWVACEYWRALALGGFPWFFLSHSHYKLLPMIQVSDLFGAYALSFVIAAVNGVLAEWLIPPRTGVRRRVPGIGLGVAVLLVALSFGYGRYRLGQDTMSPGPRVAVLQGNFPSEVVASANSPTPMDKQRIYSHLIKDANQTKPDIFVLPESPWMMCLNPSFWEEPAASAHASKSMIDWSRMCYDYFQRLANESGAYVVTGAGSLEPRPTQVYPKSEKFNSAFVFRPNDPPPWRYDKVHLVMFGEYVPLRGTRWHFIYKWLNDITPWGSGGYEYSCTHGKEFKVFQYDPPDGVGRSYSFGIPICYEDTMPYIGREFVHGKDGGKQAEFLLNISNDGWYNWGFELTQHLASSVFRAVENRVGVARSVNCGISAIIDANGKIVEMVADENGQTRGRDIMGFVSAPIMTDTRLSLYTRIGDVFAKVCLVITLLMLLDAFVCRWLAIREHQSDKQAAAEGAKNS